MWVFNFVVLSVIAAPYNVPTPHISKTHFPFASLNVRELELNYAQKTIQRKREDPPPAWGRKANSPPPPPPRKP